MALPLPMLLLLGLGVLTGSPNVIDVLVALNLVFVLIRVLLQGALAGSYDRPGLAFWLSPLADPLAVLRVCLSTLRRPRAWRGRRYD